MRVRSVASVLVSEVERDVRRLLIALVERLGHDAIVLEPVVVVPPRADVLLVDPTPRLGTEHLRLVRAFYPELPVICMGPLRDSSAPIGRGPVCFLPKPFAPEQLTAALDRSLRPSASPV
jgi:DNA-binding NtrC family response regulator